MNDRILPCYVVCDRSCSMADVLPALNAGLTGLHAALRADPVIADIVRVCIIGFSATAEVLQPLRGPAEMPGTVELAIQPATSFTQAFSVLRATIDADIRALQAASHQVYRPAVFFFSDGHPSDPISWSAAYSSVVDQNWPAWPHILAFGVGDADVATIARIGTVGAYRCGVVGLDAVLRNVAHLLVTSVVRVSEQAGVAQAPSFSARPIGLPEPVDLVPIPVDLM